MWGLGAAWSGRRAGSGTWDTESRWLSYDLAHFRGQYWDPEKPRLVVSHQFKIESVPEPGSRDAPHSGVVHPRSVEDAAVTAVVQYVSDNNALGLTREDRREWTRSAIETQGRQRTLDADWPGHELILDGDAVPARLKWMPNGFCLVAETKHCFLALSARHMPALVRLSGQDSALRRYKTR